MREHAPKLNQEPEPVSAASHPSLVHRKCACGGRVGECSQCQNERSHIPPIVSDVLNSSGASLDNPTLSDMETRFGHDFSRVRVHSDERAAESAKSINARAYTYGRDVVFGDGQYAPHSDTGRQLLAHELAHVVHKVMDTVRLVKFKA